MNWRVGGWGDDERLGPRVALSPRDILCRSRGSQNFHFWTFSLQQQQPVGISFFYLGSRSAFWVVFCVFVEATIFSTSVRPPNFPAPKQKRSRLLHVENSDTIR